MNHSSAAKSYQWLILANATVTVCYALVSWVFLIVAVPPGYSSPFWPGAGLALAAVLMHGPRLSFGIFLGSWLVNFIHVDVPLAPFFESLTIGLLAAGVATGAVLQALLGRYLVLRFCEKPLRLDRHGSVLKFLFVLAPLSCLVSPSVGVSLLYLAQKIDPETILVNWFTWWIGDAFGAAMFLPMILAFFGKPSLLWRPRRLSLCLPAASLICVLLLLNSKTAEWQSANVRGLMKLHAQQLLNRLEHSLFQTLLLAQSNHGDLLKLDSISQSDFQRLRQNLQKSPLAMQSLRLVKNRPGLEAPISFQWMRFQGPFDPYRRQLAKATPGPGNLNHAEFFAPTAELLMAHVLVKSESRDGDSLLLEVVYDFSAEIQQSQNLMGFGEMPALFADNDRGESTPSAPGVQWVSEVPRTSDKLYMVLILPFSSMLAHPQKEYFFTLSFGLILALTLFSIVLVASGQSYRFEMLFLKRSQELKEQQLKAEHSAKMAALGSMAGSIAHEINNPLAIIHGYAQFLLQKIESDRSEREELRYGLTRIKDTCERISDIIKALRSYARDDRQDDLIDCSITEIISETLHLCFELLKNKQVSITWNQEHNLEVSFRGRKAAMMQALLNLINNACDAVSGLEKKWISIDLEVLEREDQIQVRVTDSGPGIPPDIREKIMLPFFSTKANGSGTGLGLSISKNLIETMGGRLTLDETVPNTCFVLSLPRSHS